MLKRILLATDGSPSARDAARWAGELARQLGDVTVIVAHVVPGPGVYVGADGTTVLEAEPLTAEQLVAVAQPVVEEAERIIGPGVRTDHRTMEGLAAESIVNLAAKENADLIVIGRRGLNPLAQLVLGSVSERVTRLARCPVTVVKD